MVSDSGGDNQEVQGTSHANPTMVRSDGEPSFPSLGLRGRQPEDVAPEIEAELVHQFQKGVPLPVLALNIFFALLLIGIQWQYISHPALILWFVIELVIVIANGLILHAYRKGSLTLTTAGWRYLLSLGATLNGISWGIGGVLLYTPLAPIQSVFVLLAIAGICSGVSTIQGSLKLGFFGTVVPALVIPAVMIFVLHGAEHFMASVLFGLYLPFISFNAMSNRRSLIETIRLRLDKERLLEDANRSESHFRALIDNAADLIGVLDFSGKIQFLSPSIKDVLGYSMEEIRGKTILDLVNPDDFESAKRSLEQVQEGYDGEVIGELRYRHRHGNEVILESRGRVLDRSKETILVFARDVTERSKMEHELVAATVEAERASQAKGRFLAHMSHEIRTPIHAILAMGDMLQRSGLNKAQLLRVTTLNNAGQHLLSLINDILDFSSFESGKVKLYDAPFDLQELLNNVQELLRLVAESKFLDLNCVVADGVEMWREGDVHRIRQILINLLGNALKFTEQGGVILRVSAPAEETLCFVIEDTGKGISEAQIEHIFDSFSQMGCGDTPGSTGLGLSITQSLASAMQGDIQVESRVGEGSRFSVTIRVPVSSQSVPEKIGASTNKIAEALNSVRVLVADDEPINRMVIEDYLKDVTKHLHMVTNGQEVVEQAMANEYDIILMDMRMPVMDGLSATQAIRAQEVRQNQKPVPIIALSAAVLEEERESFANAGCTAFLAKPVDRDSLLEEIGRCIR